MKILLERHFFINSIFQKVASLLMINVPMSLDLLKKTIRQCSQNRP